MPTTTKPKQKSAAFTILSTDPFRLLVWGRREGEAAAASGFGPFSPDFLFQQEASLFLIWLRERRRFFIPVF
jgi:hypothetical protein